MGKVCIVESYDSGKDLADKQENMCTGAGAQRIIQQSSITCAWGIGESVPGVPCPVPVFPLEKKILQ